MTLPICSFHGCIEPACAESLADTESRMHFCTAHEAEFASCVQISGAAIVEFWARAKGYVDFDALLKLEIMRYLDLGKEEPV